MKRISAVFLLAVVLIYAAASTACAAVDLELRPARQVVHVGELVSIGMYARSIAGNWPVSALDAVVFHTPTELSLLDLSSSGSTYKWMLDGMMIDAPDNINRDIEDGQVMYTAWAQLGTPAYATPKGLLATTFQFQAVIPVGRTYVEIVPSYGLRAKSRVFDGTSPNKIVTGTLGRAWVMIVPANTLITVAEAKSKQNGLTVQVAGPIVTRSFGSFFYLEDRDRTAGIKVNTAAGQVPAQGTTPYVTGTITTINGERVINNATVTSGDTDFIPGALAMNNYSIFGSLNPQGLLVKVCGRVAGSTGGAVFTLTDGYAQPVRVELHGVTAPANDLFVTVTGVLGADTSGPILRANNVSDVRLVQE